MKKATSESTFLPLLKTRTSEASQKSGSLYNRSISQLTLIQQQKLNSISRMLTQVRQSMKACMEDDKSLQKQRLKKQQHKKKKQNLLTKKQKKIYFDQNEPAKENQPVPLRQTMRKLSSIIPYSAQFSEIASIRKPPHRSKMAMCIDESKLYIYGGLGCEPNLKLAIFDLETKKWNFLKEEKFAQYHPSIPITGHSFAGYKGRGFVYGGKSTDIVNELSIVNFKDLKISEGQRCQFRRKEHAMTMVSKFMVIHGGVEANEVKNELFFYNTQTNTWVYPFTSTTLPFLANHSMTSSYPFKTKKKLVNSLTDITDPIYLFGGQDKKGNLSRALYKITVQNDLFLATKIQITAGIWPQKRMQMAFHHIGYGFLLLYGGKMNECEDEGENNVNKENTVYAFQVDKQEWMRVPGPESLHDHYGMASAENNGKIYVFGGLENNIYSNGNITTITTWSNDMIKSKSNFGTRMALTYKEQQVS